MIGAVRSVRDQAEVGYGVVIPSKQPNRKRVIPNPVKLLQAAVIINIDPQESLHS